MHMTPWLSALHIIAMVAWFAGLFYLPRLFIYHSNATDKISSQRFKIMEHKLFYIITLPASIATLLTGLGLLYAYAWQMYAMTFWLTAKLICVLLLYIFQYFCWKYLHELKQDNNQKTARFYRFFNEVPTLLLFAIVILAVVKP